MNIISGGQTGVDRIGLETAKESGLETGGTAPKDYRTELGSDPTLKTFGLKEDFSRSYGPRTRRNVLESDGTVLFGDTQSAGSASTIKTCRVYRKPCIANPTRGQLLEFIRRNKIEVLNVAGNRGSKSPAPRALRIRQTLLSAFQNLGWSDPAFTNRITS